MRLKKKRHPDYAFERVREDIEDRKSSHKRILIVVLFALIALGILIGTLFLHNTQNSYETKSPRGELVIEFPANKTEYEISPGEEFTFDISAHYELSGKAVHYGIAEHDKCMIGMFFSDNRLCERTSYDTIVLNEDVKPSTKFSVTLKYNDVLSIIEFKVVEKTENQNSNNQ